MIINDSHLQPLQRERGAGARTDKLWFTVQRHCDVTVFRAHGELDASNIQYLADVLTQFLRMRGGLVVELGALQFCSVAGMEFFIYFDRRCRGARCPWVLVPGASLRRLLRLSGVSLPVAGSLDEAANALGTARSHRPTLRIAT